MWVFLCLGYFYELFRISWCCLWFIGCSLASGWEADFLPVLCVGYSWSFFFLCMPLPAHGWLWLTVFSRRCAMASYPHAIFEQLTVQILHSVLVCCSLGHFSSFSRLFCSLLFPSKMFHSFCSVLSEILSAKLSFDSCITSESAWIILDDLAVFLSFNYTSSSVSSTPESTFPTGCAPSCWQIPCLLILISHDSMSKVLLKSRRHDSYCFSSII